MAIYRDIFGRIINKVYNTIWNKSAIKENFMKNILTFLVVYLQFVFYGIISKQKDTVSTFDSMCAEAHGNGV